MTEKHMATKVSYLLHQVTQKYLSYISVIELVSVPGLFSANVFNFQLSRFRYF